MTVRTIDEIFRDFVTDGVPASGPFNPHKPDIRDTLKALTEGSDNFPDNRVIRLNNANEGTANNIVVTASVAIPAAAYQVLYILNVTQENTGPVTVSGAINRDLVTNINQPVPAGYLTPGMALLCIDTGTELRLLSYGDAEAILAAAEAAALRSEQAAQDAEDAAATANGVAPVVNRVQLKVLDYSEKKSAIIYGENGRNGTFAFVQSDLSAKVALDPQEGIYVPPASDPTGASGAWVRHAGWHVSGVNAEWFGVVADSDGTTGNGTDNQPAFQAACDTLQALSIPAVNMPMGIIRFGSQVLVQKKSITIRGAGMGLPDAWPDPIIPTRSNGTWLYFDHTAIGIKFEIDETNPRFASRVEHLSTMRNHPEPSVGWGATPSSPDFDMWNHMVHFDDIGLLNPYIAFRMNSAPCSFNHIRSQPLYRFVTVDETADVCRWNDIHCWPYWSLSDDVSQFTKTNLIIFDLGRCDNPQLSNVFSIRQRHGIRIRQGATGATQRLKGTNIEFDVGGSGLTTTDDTSNLIIQLVNFVAFCSTEIAADTRGVEIQGNGHHVQITNMDISNPGAQAVLVLGTGNKLGVVNYRLYNYGENTASAPGIEVGGTNSRIILEGVEDVSTPQSGPKYATGGTGCAIVRDDWRSYSPSVTSSTGTLGSVTGIVGRYRRSLKSIDFQVEFVVNDIGTGAGAIRVSLPETSSAFASATGQQVNSGFNLNGTIDTGVSYVDLRKYDGTFPGVNSTAIRISGTYPVA